MKPKTKTAPVEELTELTLLSEPAELVEIIRNGDANTLPTKQLNTFYVLADAIEKTIKELKGGCRPVIIGRREEGVPTGEDFQHREFTYQTPQGDFKLTIQERLTWKPHLQKLEAFLKRRNLWELAQTTALDLDKVEGLHRAGMITADEMAAVSSEEPTYALIAKFKPKE